MTSVKELVCCLTTVYPVPFNNVSQQSAVSTVCREGGREVIRRKEGRKEGRREGWKRREVFSTCNPAPKLAPMFYHSYFNLGCA
jgi:hypothetical protein